MWFECVTTKNLSRVDGMVWEVPEMLGWYLGGQTLILKKNYTSD